MDRRCAPLTIRAISAEDALRVRHPVLRAGRPRETAILECDPLPETAHFGAFEGDRLVAVATVHPDLCPGRTTVPAWRLRGMATLEPYRGRGAGRALIRSSVTHVRERGGRLLWCNGRLGAAGFYEGNGFLSQGARFDLPPNGPHLLFVLEL
jgi:GNAT superfamily N-acetyltransferase